jgi:hypothetical protein
MSRVRPSTTGASTSLETVKRRTNTSSGTSTVTWYERTARGTVAEYSTVNSRFVGSTSFASDRNDDRRGDRAGSSGAS